MMLLIRRKKVKKKFMKRKSIAIDHNRRCFKMIKVKIKRKIS